MISGNLTYEDILKTESPPEASDLHLLVQHKDFIRYIHQHLRHAGYEVGQTRVGMAVNGYDMITAVEVKKLDVETPYGLKMWLGAMNCNSRKRASSVYGGVTQKTNTPEEVACVFSHFGSIPKYSKYDWKDEMAKMVDHFADDTEWYPAQVAAMQELRYRSVTESYGVIIRAANCKFIPISYVQNGMDYINANHKSLGPDKWSLAKVFTPMIHRCDPVYDSYPRRDQLSQLWNVRNLIMQEQV